MYNCDIDFVERKIFSKFRKIENTLFFLLLFNSFNVFWRFLSFSRRFNFVVDNFFFVEI